MIISVIIPTLNEADTIVDCLNPLQILRRHGHELIIVDGGSSDDTVTLAAPLCDRIIRSDKGRARQMNAGAGAAVGDIFLFLHADTIIPFAVADLLENRVQCDSAWGRFDVRLSGTQPLLRTIEFFMNVRSRLTGIATGDQAIFVTRVLFRKVGGFPDIELMEDIELSKKLKRYCPALCLADRVITSSRRWEQRGIIRTVWKMWSLRLRYLCGANPVLLAKDYD
ncbi:MAG: TIGR04283 family arsenosugar biosynthesis glycosyltransferase [Gammaproteobacteria bacterium]